MFESFTAYTIFYFILSAILIFMLINEKKLVAIEFRLRRKFRAYRKAKRIEKYKKEAQLKNAVSRADSKRRYVSSSDKSYAA